MTRAIHYSLMRKTLQVEPRNFGARFGSTATRKAILHTWLAWQKEPGRPYGVAIKARYFGATSAAADQFVAWFERVFGVGPSE